VEGYRGCLPYCVVVYILEPGVHQILPTHYLVFRLLYGFRATEIVFRKPTDSSNTRVLGLDQADVVPKWLARAIDPKLLGTYGGRGLVDNGQRRGGCTVQLRPIERKTWGLYISHPKGATKRACGLFGNAQPPWKF
jgi:hypothetical protein